MQAIIKTLDSINNYIGYLYLVVFIAVVVMLVRVLLALMRLYHSASDFDMAIEAINESYASKKQVYENYKNKTRSIFSSVLKVIAGYELSRMYLSRKKRAELHREKDDISLRAKHDKYIKRLLED